MRRYVIECKENTCINSNRDHSLDEEWTEIARTINVEWSNGLARWQRVVIEAEHLKTELGKLESTSVIGTSLTRNADTAMSCYGSTIRDVLRFVVEYDSYSLVHSIKMMREYYVRHEKANRRLTTHDLDPNRQSDRIMYTIMALQEVVEDGFPDGILWWIGKLKHGMRDVPYNKGVENWLSGMALLDELHTLWCWRQTAGHQEPVTEDALTREIIARDSLPPNFNIRKYRTSQAIMGKSEGDRECGRLLRGFCELSVPKGPKDLSWLKKTVRAREVLAKFWQCVRGTWSDRQKRMGRFEAFTAQVLSHMSFDISPDFFLKLEEERQHIETKHKAEKSLKEQLQGDSKFTPPSWDTSKGEDGVVRRNLPKKSNAVRNNAPIEDRLRHAILEQAPPEDTTVASQGSELKTRIPVKQDTLSLMAKIFPTGADGTNTVRWTQFLQAVTDAGMTATQGAGSAVVFRNHQGSIAFHMPHPEPVVDAVKLRGFGKRLHKWFGWRNDTFVLRQKDGN
jgi:hypothetical protein